MADSIAKQLRIVVVTPERSVVDESCDYVVLPMFDGELGVLPGHSALVGQLGPGELRYTRGSQTTSFFIDGGFAQVRTDVINVLTQRAIPVSELSVSKAEQARSEAESMPEGDAYLRSARDKALNRARAMALVLNKGHK